MKNKSTDFPKFFFNKKQSSKYHSLYFFDFAHKYGPFPLDFQTVALSVRYLFKDSTKFVT